MSIKISKKIKNFFGKKYVTHIKAEVTKGSPFVVSRLSKSFTSSSVGSSFLSMFCIFNNASLCDLESSSGIMS